MDWVYFLEQLKEVINPIDTLSILITFFISQRVKVVLPEKSRPIAAIAVGLVIACGWGLKTGDWKAVPGNGFLYGAGAIALYMIGLGKLIRSLPGGDAVMGD